MARQNRAANPSSDNRSQMMTQGNFAEPSYPDPSAIEASAVESNPGEIMSMGNPTLPVIDEATGQAQVPDAPAQPAPEPQAPAAPPAEPVDPVVARFKAMTPEQLVEQAANLERLRGKHAEEVGTYRKLFDKFMEGKLPTAPQTPVAPQPTPVVEDESALVTEILTSPKKFMEKVEYQVMSRLEAERSKAAIQEQMRTHQATMQTPEFQQWLVNVPRHVVEQADRDPQMFSWLMGQFKPTSSTAVPAPVAPVAATPAHAPTVRTVPLGAANGGPSAATRPEITKPTFARAELARMMLERPDEYRAREEEITLAYIEGRVR